LCNRLITSVDFRVAASLDRKRLEAVCAEGESRSEAFSIKASGYASGCSWLFSRTITIEAA